MYLVEVIENVDEIIETDILIIGAEAAGAIAATEASKHDVNVMLVTKGRQIGSCGATITAAGSSIAIDGTSSKEYVDVPGDPRDNKELFFEDIIREGKYINDQRQVEAVVEEVGERARELMEWGFKWDEAGLKKTPGHRYPRDCLGLHNWGRQFSEVMRKKVDELKNVDIKGDMFVLDLLTSNGRVVGAVALGLQTGKIIVFQAKATIIATGGAHYVYPYVTTGYDLTADGHAMVLRVGAEFCDPQLVQFKPVVVWPKYWAHCQHGCLPQIRPFYRFYNMRGQRFMAKWDPKRMERTTRDFRTIGVAAEILEGRGGQHGGVYVGMKDIPDEVIDYGGKWAMPNWVHPSGFNFKPLIEKMKRGFAFEIADGVHFFLGGIRINEDGETNVPGLYAAGECCGGMNGTNRISGVALSQCIVQGARAGRAAAAYVKGVPSPVIDVEEVETIRRKAFSALERKEGVSAVAVRKQLHKIMYHKVGTIKTREWLEEAIKEIGEIKKTKLSVLSCKAKNKTYNLEWIEALQVVNMIQYAEVMAEAALFRTETRGAHFRRDCLYMDNDNWLKNVIVKQVKGELQLTAEAVPITKLQPPPGMTEMTYPEWGD